MKKLSQINEGMFKASIQRSNSNKVRKEDDVINNLNSDDFFDYLKNNYELIDKTSFRREKSKTGLEIFAPVIGRTNYLICSFSPTDEITDIKISSYGIDDSLYKQISNKYHTYFYSMGAKAPIHIQPYHGEYTNEIYIDILDLLLSIVDKPALKKRT